MKKIMTFALAAALFTACKKDEKKADTTGSGAATPTAAGSAAPAAPTPAPAPTPTEAAKPAEPAAGAAAGAARPASVTDADVALADQMVKELSDFGDALGKAGTDCKAATAAAKTFAEKFKPIAEQAEKIKERQDKDPAAKAWFEATYKPKMMGFMGPMMKTAQACATDKDFTAAMQSIPMPGGKHKM